MSLRIMKQKDIYELALGDKTKSKIDFKNNNVWKLLKITYHKSNEEIKLSLTKELEEIKY